MRGYPHNSIISSLAGKINQKIFRQRVVENQSIGYNKDEPEGRARVMILSPPDEAGRPQVVLTRRPPQGRTPADVAVHSVQDPQTPRLLLVSTGWRVIRAESRSESGAIPLFSDEDQTLGGMTAEDIEHQDLIEGVDEDGNKILLEVVRYFFYNGDEYVVLGDAQTGDECGCHCDGCEHTHEEEDDEEEVNLYIMKVVPSGDDEDTEEFVPVEDEDLLGKLIEVVQTDFEKEAELEDEE